MEKNIAVESQLHVGGGWGFPDDPLSSVGEYVNSNLRA